MGSQQLLHFFLDQAYFLLRCIVKFFFQLRREGAGTGLEACVCMYAVRKGLLAL